MSRIWWQVAWQAPRADQMNHKPRRNKERSIAIVCMKINFIRIFYYENHIYVPFLE